MLLYKTNRKQTRLREVKNNVFTVLCPLPRNCTLIITEKYIKTLNITTGSQVEEKKSLSSAHTPFSALEAWIPTPAGWEEKRRGMGRKWKLWDESSNSLPTWATEVMLHSRDARELQRALQVPAPHSLHLWAPLTQILVRAAACRSTPRVIIHMGTGGANLQWARGKSREKEKVKKKIDSRGRTVGEHTDLWDKGQRIIWGKGKHGWE